MERNQTYSWVIETIFGDQVSQFNSDGTENSWKDLNPNEISKVSFIPKTPLLPQHCCIIDTYNGNRFIRKFGRGFLKQKNNFKLTEYLNCVITKDFRFYLLSDGKVIVTPFNYELML